MNLKEKLKKLPITPGVYLMKDSKGNVLYVGKSKHLKKRVQSYFQPSKNHSSKIERLVNHLKDFDYIQTDTEFEAFMLECKLIKEIKPLYNRMMKNPKSYTYIVIRENRGFPKIELTNQVEGLDWNLYFGPFTSKRGVEKAINSMKEFYQLECSHTTYRNSPCLNYSLGLCMGICFDHEAREKYHQIMNRMIGLFEGSDMTILEEMEQEMIESSTRFDFERAAKLRDWTSSIQSMIQKEEVIKFTKENKNIIVIESIEDKFVKLILINGNKVLFKQMLELNDDLVEKVLPTILLYFPNEHRPALTITKDDIDEAQIIYRYLESGNCEYTIIPYEWLLAENHFKIEDSIRSLLYKVEEVVN